MWNIHLLQLVLMQHERSSHTHTGASTLVNLHPPRYAHNRHAGGTPAVLKYLLSKGLLRGEYYSGERCDQRLSVPERHMFILHITAIQPILLRHCFYYHLVLRRLTGCVYVCIHACLCVRAGHCMTATCQSLADTLRPLPGVPGMTGEDETSAARRIVMPTPGAAAPAAVSSAAARSPTDATPSSPPPPPPSTGAAGLTPPELARRLLRPIENPLKPSGHITIMRGNVAPGGAVAKITGKEGLSFTGRVCVYEGEGAMLKSLERGELHARLGITRPAGRPQANAAATLAEAAAAATAAAATAAAGVWSSLGPVTRLVVVIRGEGPVGGPGMLEMLTPTSAIMGAGLGLQVAMLTDGRFSGGSHGFIVGHIVPEAALGGPVGLLVDGDLVEIDATTRTINAVNISEEEWARRRAAWTPPQPKEVALSGTLRKYVQLVRSASEGCVTDA